MYLGEDEGFNNSGDAVHIGDTFQRAMLVECLLLSNLKHSNIDDMIRDEVNYLLSVRNKSGIPAWSYFPSVEEISPDIDDLAQITRVLFYAGRKDIVTNVCMPLIDFASTFNYSAKFQTFETWLIPPLEHRNEMQTKQGINNVEKWGTGPDTEVVANIVLTLSVVDENKYKKEINEGIKYLLNKQDDIGYWASRWYEGKYYATYLCSRIFSRGKATTEQKLALAKASDFLVSDQQKSGAWNQSVMNTSFAIICLRLCCKKPTERSKEVSEAIAKGKRYLIKSVCQLSRKNTTPFIIPRVGIPFKSLTLEHGYAMLAMSSIR